MYRVRSTDVWFNAPGVVAAYQPIAAPDPFAAQQNTGNDLRRAGVYAAKLGVAPTWRSSTGWTFNGTTQYLTTGIVPAGNQTWSALAGFSGVTANTNVQALFGYWHDSVSANRFTVSPNFTGNIRLYFYSQYKQIAARALSGVMGIAGRQPILNGAADGPEVTTGSGTLGDIYLGANKKVSVAGDFLGGTIRCFVITSITLPLSAMAQYSRQMAYCHVNPDWSAWARRRQYFYAPSAAATFQAAWARNANSIQQVAR